MKPKLSVIVPCYNEAQNIPLVLERFATTFQGGFQKFTELIIVDNNSNDDTARVLKKELKKTRYKFARSVFQSTPGYGAAIRKGLESASGEFLCWTHADLQTDPADVVRAYKILMQQPSPQRCYVKGDRKGRPLFDQSFTTGMSLFETFYLGTVLHDINAQPNIIHRSFFQKLPQLPDDFSLDLALLYLAKRMRLRIIRFPVRFAKRIHGESSWNTSFKGKFKFIKRTLDFTRKLDARLRNQGLPIPGVFTKYVGLSFELLRIPFISFCFIGGLSTILNYLVFFVLFQTVSVNYLVASGIGYVIGVLFSFIFNKMHTFRSKGHAGLELVKYLGVYLASLLLSIALLYAMVALIGIHPLVANVLVIIVTTLTNFFGCKIFVFRVNRRPGEGQAQRASNHAYLKTDLCSQSS